MSLMVPKYLKKALTWCCVLIYIVIGTINLDSSDVAQAKATGQAALLDSLDEFVLSSALEQIGLWPQEQRSSSELVRRAPLPSFELGYSIKGVLEGNTDLVDYQSSVIDQPTTLHSWEGIRLKQLNFIKNQFSRPPPFSVHAKQLSILRTNILLI